MAKTVMALLMALIVGFAGCTSNDADSEPTSPEDMVGGDEHADNHTENSPPTASLSASSEGGVVPLNITFQMDGTDADGDALTWMLDVDGDNVTDYEGDALPANVTHSYNAAGTYNATLVVSDFKNETSANVTIVLTGEDNVAFQSFEGSFAGADSFQECRLGGSVEQTEGVFWASTDIDTATYGGTFTATFTATGSTPETYFGVSFRDETGLDELTYFETDPGAFTVAGEVDSNASVVAFYTCLGGMNVGVLYEATA